MKKLLFILVVFCSFNGFGQDAVSVVGVWVQCPNGYSSKKVEFKQDGTYRQFMSSCVGKGKHKGTYRVEDNILIMIFSVGDKERKFLIKENRLYPYDNRKGDYSNLFDMERTDSSYKKAIQNCKGFGL